MVRTWGKIAAVGSLAAVMAVAGVGCSSGDGAGSTSSAASAASAATEAAAFSAADQGMYVSFDWLQEHLDDVTVVDARSTSTFTQQHIPGAVGLHWTAISNVEVEQGQPGWGELLPSDEIAAAAAQRGIDGSKPVVVYTDTRDGWGEDGRIYWALREAGLEDVHILDGGWTMWMTKGGEVKASLHGTDNDPIDQVDTAYVKAHMDSAKIVDARLSAEYDGETTMGEAREGRIPGAISLPAVSFINADGTVISDDEIKALLDDAGLSADDEVIVYCTGGVRAAFVAETLANQGFENVSVYTAGYSEWAGDAENPIE
ncbi:MAG: rhodanese-like domain-containing protein [Eggerthellaceae bacterium]|nr:rhodanese-like domain-containing protein [Eggerthellaceae bacterium]